ncbi:MAG: DUF4418 family protein [Methanoregula sp.]|nr:DUF4418 family protein [Methanoregula sp.]
MSFNISNRSLLLAGALVILGALIVITPWYIFPVCEAKGVSSHSMSPMASVAGSDQSTGMSTGALMKCGYTARAEAAVGALVIIAGLALIALPNRISRKAVGIAGIGLGVVTALIPTILIGVCNAADAPCRIGTLPALIILGILTIVVGILVILVRNDPPAVAN